MLVILLSFKLVSNKYVHGIGDLHLKLMVQTLKTYLRTYGHMWALTIEPRHYILLQHYTPTASRQTHKTVFESRGDLFCYGFIPKVTCLIDGYRFSAIYSYKLPIIWWKFSQIHCSSCTYMYCGLRNSMKL